MGNIYLDHAATTPLHEDVLEAVNNFSKNNFANPASAHLPGQKASQAVEEAREKLADLIGATKAEEIVFTSGGTESDNLALKGAALAADGSTKHIIVSEIEHHAVLESAEFLEKHFAYDISYLSVDAEGFVDPAELEQLIRDDTVLISVMTANNEIGTIQPIKELSKIAKKYGIIFHTDAVQAVGQIEIDVEELGVDLLSLSAHKFNGPKGVGALYIKSGVEMIPQQSGGSQERNRRAGTVNTPAVFALAKAAEIAQNELSEKIKRISDLRDYFLNQIFDNFDDVVLNGPAGEKRLPGNINLSFKDLDGQAILFNLSLNDIAASTGSACASGSISSSHVLKAIDLSSEYIDGSIRFSLGYNNTKEELDKVLEVLSEIVNRLKELKN